MISHRQSAGVLYGDEVCLSELDIGGIVCGDSDLTHAVFLDRETSFTQGHVIYNQQLCQFKILPKFQYSATKAFRKKLQRSQVKLNESNWANKLEPSDPLYKELARDKKQIDDEQATNEMEAARTVGLQVCFGSVVQLKHIRSSHFLTQSKNRAALDKLAMEVALIPDGNEGSWWKVLPAEKVRSMGDPVRDGDKITLQNLKFQDSFLFVSTAEPVCTRGADAEDADFDAIPNLKRLSTVTLTSNQREDIGEVLLHPSCNARFEVNASPGSSRFQVSVFKAGQAKFSSAQVSKEEAEQHYVFGSATCTLYLREDDCYLASSMEGDSVEWVPSTSSNMQTAMWRLWKPEVAMGGAYLKLAGGTILLQHLASGRYLAVQPDEVLFERRSSQTLSSPSNGNGYGNGTGTGGEGDDAACCLALVQDLHSEGAVWAAHAFCEEAGSPEGALADGDVAWLEHAPRRSRGGGTHLPPSPHHGAGAAGQGGGEIGRMWLAHLRRREAGSAGFKAVCRQEGRPSNSEVIEIRMVRSSDARAVDHLSRCGRVLQGASAVFGDCAQCSPDAFSAEGKPTEAGLEHIAAHALNNIPRLVLQVMEGCLSSLVLACSRSNARDPFKSDGPPVPEHQDRLRGVGIVAHTMEGIKLLLSKVPPQHCRRWFPDVFRTVQLAFLLLQKACVGNQVTKQLLMKELEWLNAHNLYDFGCFELSIEIYRDSMELLTRVDFAEAWDVIGAMLAMPNGKARVVDIFSNICVCQGLPIAKNQNVCVDFLASYPHLTPIVEVVDDDVRIMDDSRDTWVSMRALMQFPGGEQAVLDPLATKDNQDTACYRFYLKVLDFIANALVGRNPSAAKHFWEHRARFALGPDHLMKVIGSSVYPASYRARCCVLVDKLYIDCDPHLEVQHLNFTRVWSKLHLASLSSKEMEVAYSYISDESSQCASRVLRPSELKTLFHKLILDHARTNVEELEVNRFVGACVQLVHKLLRFGFYHKYDSAVQDLLPDLQAIRTLSQPLLALLDGRSDWCAPFGSFGADMARFELAEKTVIVMEMKLEVIRVLQDLIAMAISERQRQFAECWDMVLERKFGVHDWESAKAQMRNKGGEEPARDGAQRKCKISTALHVHHAPSKDSHSGYMHVPKSNGTKSSAKVAPEQSRSSLSSMGADGAVKWTSEDVTEFATLQRDTHVLMQDFAPIELGKITGTGELPDFFKVLLDLTRYKHKALKQVAIELLFSAFSQHSQTVNMLKGTLFVTDPSTCKIHYQVREEMLKLMRSVRLLPSQGASTPVASMKLGSGKRAAMLVDEEELGVRERALEEEKLRRAEAFETSFLILRRWIALCSPSYGQSSRRKECCRRLLVNLRVDELLLSILQIPVERLPPEERQLDRLVDEQLRDLFGEVYALLGHLCKGDPRLQDRMLQHMDLHLSFAKVEGVHVEDGLLAMMHGNAEALLIQGRQLIDFFLIHMLQNYDNPSPRWIELVRSLSSTRENQMVVHKILSKHDSVTKRCVGVDKKNIDDWDDAVASLSMPGTPVYESSMLRASMLDLLSTGCSGKQPSAEVFCASVVQWLMAVRATVGPDVTVAGERKQAQPDALYRVKGSYLRFLHKVYIETSVKRLLEEQTKPDSGVWSYGDSNTSKCFLNCRTLMQCILDDLCLLNDLLNGHSEAQDNPVLAAGAGNNIPSASPAVQGNGAAGAHDELTWHLFQYVAGSVLPMLVDFYQRSEVVEAHPDAPVMSEKIHEAIGRLQESPFPADWERLELLGEPVEMRRKCWAALRAMSIEARVRPEWHHHRKNQVFTAKKELSVEANEDDEVAHALQRTNAAMLEQVARDLHVSERQGGGAMATVGLGLRQLALIMNQENEVNMYNADTFEDLGLNVPPSPQYEDFIISMLEICQDHSTKEEVLLHVLQLVRCSIYVVEPGAPKDSHAAGVAEKQWEAFLNQTAVEKITEPKDEKLQWLQERFDGMGATTAALRLVSHPSLAVQVEAVLLLLVLLQGGNRKVQNTVAVYLTRRRDRRFFQAIKDVFNHAKVGLKDFKRLVKQVKNSQRQGDQSTTVRRFIEGQRQASVGFRAASALLMYTLRLCQLLCEGQYRPFQRMMHKQSWLPSYDLLEGCLELFEVTHPMLADTMSLNDGDMSALALQMMETISEAIQGPERVNQQVVLSSNFLAGCNRMLSSLVYTPIPADTPPVNLEQNSVKVSVSDLKSWLKGACVRTTLCLFEACNNANIPRLMKEFFEVKKIVSQMVMIARILGLADPVEQQESISMDDDADFGFGSILAGSVGAFGSIKGGSVGGNSTSSRRGSQSFGSQTSHSQSFVRGGNATARNELVSSLKFSEGYEETLREELFSLYFLLRNFNEFDDSGQVTEVLLELKKDHRVLYDYLNSHTFEVELVRQHSVTQAPQAEKVFFSVSSDMLEVVNGKHYREQAQEQLFAVPRKNPTEKARALVFQLKKQMNRLTWVVTLARSSTFRRFVIRYREAFDEVPLFLSLGMTALLLTCYAVPIDPNTKDVLGGGGFYGFNMNAPGYDAEEPYPFAAETSDPSGLGATVNSVVYNTNMASEFNLRLYDRWNVDALDLWNYWKPARAIAIVVATAHIAITFVNISAHLFHEFPLIVWDAWEQYKKEMEGKTVSPYGEKLEDSNKLRPVRQGKAFLKTMRKAPEVQRTQIGMRFFVLLISKSGLLVYFSFLSTISLLAWIMSPFFHVLYLLDFFRRKSGRLVTRSLVLGAPNLLRSFWLGLIVLTCFGFMSYNYFSDTINANQQMCRTPYQCVVKHLLDSMTGDLTTVLGDDLGVFAFPPMVIWADLWEQFRSLYVFISLIFWVFLLQGIIQGQIIDAFAEMRNQADALAEDLEQKCFVSSVDRFVFNSYPGEWEKRRGGKYVFNYLLFFAHLMQKDPEDMNGLDHAVHKQFSEDAIDFLPIETFVARQREEEEARKDEEQDVVRSVAEDVRRVEQQLTSLKSTMDSMLERLPPAPSFERRTTLISQTSGPFVVPPADPPSGSSHPGSIAGRPDV